MSDTEAIKLTKIIRSGSIESAIIVVKFLGVRYKARHGRDKVFYKWLKPESKQV